MWSHASLVFGSKAALRLQASDERPSVIHGSGHSMFFDSQDDFIQVSPSCATTSSDLTTTVASGAASLQRAALLNSLPPAVLLGSRPDVTIMAWIRIPPQFFNTNDQHIIGWPAQQGPRLFMGLAAGGDIALKIDAMVCATLDHCDVAFSFLRACR